MRRAGLLWLAVVVAVSGACSRSDHSTTAVSDRPDAGGSAVGTGGAASALNKDDEFVHAAARLNMEQVQLGRLALDKAASPAVKTFAQQILADYEAAGTKLEDVVSGTSIGWPAALRDKQSDDVAELADKQGADFDRDYVKAVVHNQQDLAAMLESRLDVQSLENWKTAIAGRTRSQAMPHPAEDMHDVQVQPRKSDNTLSLNINRWAADLYPLAQKHLDTARRLENMAKKESSS